MAISGTSFCAERTEEVQKTGWWASSVSTVPSAAILIGGDGN